MPSEAYEAQVRLLVRVLPFLRAQPHLALKGGTAINLFVQDLPRLSVDLDLAYTGLEGRDEALANIHAALLSLKTALETLGLRVHATPLKGTASWVKLVVSDGDVQVKVEVSPVLRGTVYSPILRQTTPSVQARFGFAEVPVLALPDLYAGKLVAALDRQHPRDLYDVRLFLAQDRLSREVVLAFLVYLVSHGRPMDEVLRPHFKDLSREYNVAFVGMTVEDVSLEALEQARTDLLSALHAQFTPEDRAFLLSVAGGRPDWEQLPLPGVADLPAVRWKLHNIAQMDARKRHAAAHALERPFRRADGHRQSQKRPQLAFRGARTRGGAGVVPGSQSQWAPALVLDGGWWESGQGPAASSACGTGHGLTNAVTLFSLHQPRKHEPTPGSGRGAPRRAGAAKSPRDVLTRRPGPPGGRPVSPGVG